MEKNCCKIVFLGGKSVGKSSIINRYNSKAFDDKILASKGANFCSKIIKIKEREVKMDIWDTAGDDAYRSLIKFFFKDANAIIFVYDISSYKSFEEIKNFWYDEVKIREEKNSLLFLVGNKSDLISMKEVKDKEAKQYAKKNGMMFQLVSAKDNNMIYDLFEKIAKKMICLEDDHEKESLEDNDNEENDLESENIAKENKEEKLQNEEKENEEENIKLKEEINILNFEIT